MARWLLAGTSTCMAVFLIWAAAVSIHGFSTLFHLDADARGYVNDVVIALFITHVAIVAVHTVAQVLRASKGHFNGFLDYLNTVAVPWMLGSTSAMMGCILIGANPVIIKVTMVFVVICMSLVCISYWHQYIKENKS